MSKQFNITITLDQLNKWCAAVNIKGLEWFEKKFKFGGPEMGLEEFLRCREDIHPQQVDTKVRCLILDEGVDPADISFEVLDERTGIKHRYNPPIENSFSGAIEYLIREGKR